MALSTLLLIYVVGGVTFVPLLALVLGAFAYVAFSAPVASIKSATTTDSADSTYAAKLDDEVSEKSKAQNEPDVAAAYFAVCREYVPGGINGKPPERSTPAGEVLIAESPSVYQSMYRSIFERGKTQIPSIEGDKRDGKAVKKARNVFFVVLRHGHLMLYDDAEQVEVRHVVSLAHHDIDIYAGGEAVPEGDLWIKRNCIRLTRKPLDADAASSPKPFYFFSDNCSEKEDFYHALLLTQTSIVDTDPPPLPQKFDTSDIIKLVQNLHAADADAHSRWINAIVGRIFLAMYKTQDIENFIRAKINRKISRVPKPNFITSISIREIDMGDSAPIISNPRLKELTVNGDMTVEVDVKYNGGFKLQMGAVARIDLGTRFKAREVTLVMAGVLKKLSGHLLIHIKPPPSNRIWMTFETMPHIEMSIEPIVSSRQITYGVILRAIESRIREVIGETIVLPNWDDSPFMDTQKKDWRGGIFESLAKEQTVDEKETAEEAVDAGLVETAVQELANSAGDGDSENVVIPTLADTKAKTVSMPSLFDPVQKLNLRKSAKKSVTSLAGDGVAASTGTSSASTPTQTPASPPLRPRTPPGKPRNLRSNSFATAATPLVSTEGSNIEAVKSQTKKKGQKDAVELVKEVSSRTQPATPSATSPGGSRTSENILPIDAEDFSRLAAEENDKAPKSIPDTPSDPSIIRRRSEPLDQHSSKQRVEPQEPAHTTLSPSATMPVATPKPSSVKSLDASSLPASSPSQLSTAANAAKKWGWQVLNRQKRLSISSPNTTASSVSLPSQPPNPDALKAALLAQPIGRGQPLPPPGQPLPGPQKSLWASSALNLGGLKRKPVASQQPSQPPSRNAGTQEQASEGEQQPPPLPARPRPVGQDSKANEPQPRTAQQPGFDTDVFVVAAPVEDDSLPNTPTVEFTNHGIPTQVEGAQETPQAGSSTVEAAHEKAERATMPVQETPQHDTKNSDEETVVESTKARSHAHDEDGEVGDSLDAAGVAGELSLTP